MENQGGGTFDGLYAKNKRTDLLSDIQIGAHRQKSAANDDQKVNYHDKFTNHALFSPVHKSFRS